MNLRAILYLIVTLTGTASGQNVNWDNTVDIRIDTNINNSEFETYQSYRLIDSLTYGCVVHKIIKDSGDYFLVNPFYDETEIKAPDSLWLKKSDMIKIYVRYSKGMLNFYSGTDSHSSITHAIDIGKNNLFGKSVVVLNCRQDWYKVVLNLNRHSYIGWIKSEELCPNPCSSCN